MTLSFKSGNFFKALLKHFHSENEDVLLRYLPLSYQEKLKDTSFIGRVDFPSLFSPRQALADIHYSWFLSPLQKLSPSLRSIFIQSFTKEQRKRLQENLNASISASSPPEFVQFFFLDYLKKLITEEEVLCIYELPPSEMNVLLQLKKVELVHLIDLLGIHDLASDLRQVVDNVFLGKIHGALTQEQLHFLHYCLKQPLKWVPPKLNLAGWDGDKKTLNLILHQRGLVRFGKALSNTHASLQWHLCHRLDTGRASIITKVLTGKQDPAMIPYFRSQVLHLVRRYQR